MGAGLRGALAEHLAARGVGPLLLRALLEDEGGSLGGLAVENLLLGDEVHLGRLLLHLVAELARGQDLLLLHEAARDALRSELERVLTDWGHETEALVLVAGGHGRTPSPARVKHGSGLLRVWDDLGRRLDTA